MRVTFDDWTLDSDRRELSQAGRVVPLTPKGLELLKLLLEHRSKAIPKALVHDRLWPGTIVSESNLSSLVSELRRLLGDDARRPRFVRTVHGFGYAFCGEAVILASDPAPVPDVSYRLIFREREVVLGRGENLIGRDPAACVRIDDPLVSRRHARILVQTLEALLEDLSSRNGTLLNGQAATSATRLCDGDEIRVGPECLLFRAISRSALCETRPAGMGATTGE